MTDSGRWMPLPAEMHVLQAKVGGDEQIGARGDAQYSAIIPDATHHRLGGRRSSELPDVPDQVSFCEHQLFDNYIKTNDLLLS